MPNQRAKDDISKAVRDAFDQMDKNDDGKVCFLEFKDYCSQVGGMDEILKLFAQTDTSDDQHVSVEELADLVNKVPADEIEECHVRKLFKELDTSGDGSLDRAEFEGFLLELGYPESTIKGTCDAIAGDDNKISCQEFIDAWNHEG